MFQNLYELQIERVSKLGILMPVPAQMFVCETVSDILRRRVTC